MIVIQGLIYWNILELKSCIVIIQPKKKKKPEGKRKQNQKKSSSIVQGFGILTQWFCSRSTGRPNATAVFVQILYNT